MRRERLEVEREPVPGPVGRDGHAVDDLQRLREVALQAMRCTVRSCAPCEVTGRLCASARAATLRKTVIPPTLHTSGSGNVTAPAVIMFWNS